MAEMDQGIKRLIQTHPADMLALAVPDAQCLGPLQVDVATEPQLVLDTLLRVRYHGIECAVDIEAEARPHAEIGRRLFEYGSRASIVTGLPIFSAVLWLERGGTPAPSPYELRADDRLLATWHFTGIEVYRLRADELIEQGSVSLMPLIPFADGGKDLLAIERAALVVKERARTRCARISITTGRFRYTCLRHRCHPRPDAEVVHVNRAHRTVCALPRGIG